MNDLYLIAILLAIIVLLAALLFTRRSPANPYEQIIAVISNELSLNRRESAQQANFINQSLDSRLKGFKDDIELRHSKLGTETAAKLDEIRKTVDDNLRSSLEQHFGQSFKQVSDRLEQVHRGLGEMQNLATGVGDLQRLLTNVKTRGTWGEVQLGNLLSQIMTPEQYISQFAINENSQNRVDFAIQLPGRDNPVYLPIDAKFPREDYELLVQAADRGDALAVEALSKALEAAIYKSAKDISAKYICPPRTTDFAILFLPAESLYAEILRRPGLVDKLQRECRIVVAGPTTLAALLNSLQMGFRTLAIEKRSSEVWQLLSTVKKEFANYGTAVEKVGKKLNEAINQINEVEKCQRTIDRKLRDVQIDTGNDIDTVTNITTEQD